MTTWHVDQSLLISYVQGRLSPSQVLAIDAHLQACAPCRDSVPSDPDWLDRSWNRIAGTLDERRVVPDHRIRLLTATPALRWSWLAATTAVLAFAVLGARTDLLIFLVFAPVLPVLTVATVYGPPADPMHEITSTTPTAGPALVLWRATAVVGSSMAMGAAASALLPGPWVSAAAWLLPALLLCVSTLALATVIPLVTAAAVFGGAWLLAVAGTAMSSSAVLFGPPAQLTYLVAGAAAAATLTVRRSHLVEGDT